MEAWNLVVNTGTISFKTSVIYYKDLWLQKSTFGFLNVIWCINSYTFINTLQQQFYISYAISVILGPDESEHSCWKELSVPLMAEHPILVIEEKTNGSVIFVMNNNEMNRKCKVIEQYSLNSFYKMFSMSSSIMSSIIMKRTLLSQCPSKIAKLKSRFKKRIQKLKAE